MPAVVRPHVRIEVARGIKLPQLEQLLKQIVATSGCRTCGLGGFDFSILVTPDPGLKVRELRGTPGVEGLTVGS